MVLAWPSASPSTSARVNWCPSWWLMTAHRCRCYKGTNRSLHAYILNWMLLLALLRVVANHRPCEVYISTSRSCYEMVTNYQRSLNLRRQDTDAPSFSVDLLFSACRRLKTSTSCTQSGQVLLCFSHSSTHAQWKQWLQGSRLNMSFPSNSLRHTAQLNSEVAPEHFGENCSCGIESINDWEAPFGLFSSVSSSSCLNKEWK